ncbi:MAG: hypothetical protein R6U19_04430 [Bacteroidales bacterium]
MILTVLITLGVNSEADAQFYTGGNIGADFDNDGYYIDASPLFGYRLEKVRAGISPFYSHRDFKKGPSRYSYGGRVFTQYTFIKNVFVHGEFEASNIELYGEKRKWIIGLPLGAGYRKEIAPNTQAYGMVLYDVLLDDDSMVRNPILRGGVQYNF